MTGEQEARAAIVAAGRRLYERRILASIEGNMSVRLTGDRVVATPSGINKGFMQPPDMVVTDLAGNPEGDGKPSSEMLMHLAIYRVRPDLRAIVHAHPTVATGYAVAGRQLPAAVLAEIVPLADGEEMRAVALPVVFQIRFMDHLGIAPELTACVACGSADLEGSSSLSARRGGLLCPRCRAAEGGRRLAAETVRFLRSSLMGELSGVATAPAPPSRGMVMESRAALDAVLEYHHGHRVALRAQRFLDGLWKK